MSVIRSSLFFIVVTLLLAGCGGTPPKPTESEFLASKGGGFFVDREKKEIRYGLAVAPNRAIPTGSVIEAQFENPTGGTPLTTTLSVAGTENQFILTSPPVSGLTAHTNYNIEIRIYEDGSKQKLLGTHQQSLQNLINQRDLSW